MRVTASLQFVEPPAPNARTWNAYVVPGVRFSMITDVFVVCHFFRDFRGRPPSFPFLRDAAAFRLERAEPRQAGQKTTKSM